MKVQEYLETHSLEDLTNNFGIIVNEYDDRVVLNYHQIDSYKHRFNPLVMECRSLILSLPEYEVMSRSFDRFWNLGEDPNSDKFDIQQSICWEKLDGSLINIYHDGITWCCSTRKMAFAEGETRLGNTYLSVVERAFGETIEDIFRDELKTYTYIFEVVSPETRVVKSYENYEVYLLAVRDKRDGVYLNNDYVSQVSYSLNCELPITYNFRLIDDIVNSMSKLSAMDEGYVCQIDNWRIKIKNPSYLAIANIRGNDLDGLSTKRVILLVFEQNYDEYLSYFPEDREYFTPYIDAYNKMMGFIDGLWLATKDIKNQKEFAMLVKDAAVSGVLFNMRKGQFPSDIMKGMTLNSKVKMIETFK